MSDKLELKEGKEFKPETPREKPSYWEGEDPRDKDNSKDTLLTDDFEPEPENEEESDDEEPEDPSAEIIQLEDLDDTTVSQHRKGYIKTFR